MRVWEGPTLPKPALVSKSARSALRASLVSTAAAPPCQLVLLGKKAEMP
jgi:hypothetical protein